MQTNLNPVRNDRQQQITPEIAEAIKTARSAARRLEAEYFAFDWESRFEMAEELRQLTDGLDDELTDITARVAEDLESDFEDFSDWETRADAAERMRRVARALEQGRDNLTLSNHPDALTAHVNGQEGAAF